MITPQRFSAITFVASVWFFGVPTQSPRAQAAGFSASARVLKARCISCHDSDTREGGIDLTPLLQQTNGSYGEYTGLWIKVEDKVAQGEMPPAGEDPLRPAEQRAITQWFHESFVLREGMPHIGRTPLRRLTRYEFQNTLEDVLAIQLRLPYRDVITGQLGASPIETIVPSDIPGESGFDNDALRMEKIRPPLKAIADAVHHALSEFSKDSQAFQTVFGRADIPTDAREEEIQQMISAFVMRACRGNPDQIQQRTDTCFRLYQQHLETSNDSRKSLYHVLEIVLLSPEFLYRLEESRNLEEPYPVTGVELATRLSYFLWSTAPDKELLRLGQQGTLLTDDVLRSQVARMLNSPRRLAISENFAGQWLGFSDLLSNGDYLLNERWNRETYDEALFFFDELIKSNRSFLELIQSDWIYKRSSVLQSQPQDYQPIDPQSMQNVYANIFADRQSKSQDESARYDPPALVKTNHSREGGIITSPAILRLTASKDRTSPIRRGVWVLNTIIGKDLEPPANVPSLEEAREAIPIKENPTVAELIKQHVSRSECIFCHKAIDPLGLGLENFSPIGEWRTRYPDKTPVVATGVMPNGKTFETPAEMKLLLLELYQDDIAKNFVERMYAYALGRKLEPYDRVSLNQVIQKVKEDDYKTNTVIEQIVLSKPFRYRQDR